MNAWNSHWPLLQGGQNSSACKIYIEVILTSKSCNDRPVSVSVNHVPKYFRQILELPKTEWHLICGQTIWTLLVPCLYFNVYFFYLFIFTMLTSFSCLSGADIIITYFVPQLLDWLKENWSSTLQTAAFQTKRLGLPYSVYSVKIIG